MQSTSFVLTASLKEKTKKTTRQKKKEESIKRLLKELSVDKT